MEELKFSTRLNAFRSEPENYWKGGGGISTIDLIERMSHVKGLTHVELNYPQHFEGTSVEEIQHTLDQLDLKLSGIALRYDNAFYKGEFTNQKGEIRNHAIQITKEAVEVCQTLNGDVTTIWTANDGADYSFQLDYQEAWNMMVEAVREVALQYPGANISIEYKPYQPRVYSLMGDIGTTLLGIDDINCSNVGITLDFCHMLMKKENPSLSLSLATSRGKLMGIHLNDGYKDNDDGMMIGSVHLMQTLEFIYYLKLYNYKGLIYFDTFPIREDPIRECETNIEIFKNLYELIDRIGLTEIQDIIKNRDAIASQRLLLNIINESTYKSVN